jgi:hypothetical protein
MAYEPISKPELDRTFERLRRWLDFMTVTEWQYEIAE